MFIFAVLIAGPNIVQITEEFPDQRFMPHVVALDVSHHRSEPRAAAPPGAEDPDDVLRLYKDPRFGSGSVANRPRPQSSEFLFFLLELSTQPSYPLVFLTDLLVGLSQLL